MSGDPYECPRCGCRTVTLACGEGRCARPVVSRRDADGKPVAWMVGLVDLELGSTATVEGAVVVGAPDEYSLRRLRDELDYHRRDATYRMAFAVQAQNVLAAVADALGVSLEQNLPELRAAFLEAVAARDAERDALLAENSRLAALASRAAQLTLQRNHHHERHWELSTRIHWMQSVAAAAMRQGLATCRALRSAVARREALLDALAPGWRERAEPHPNPHLTPNDPTEGTR